MKRILFFFILIITASFAFSQSYKVVGDKIMGVVGDRIILYSDIQNAIADAARGGQPVPEGAECIIMEQALMSKVLMLQAEKDSLPVSEEEIEAELDQRIRYFTSQYGSKEILEEVAGKTVYQIKDEARESVKENKLAQAMQRKIVERVHITPKEAEVYYNKIPKDSLPYFESELEICQIILYPKANRDLELYDIEELKSYKKLAELKTSTFEQLMDRYSKDPGKERSRYYQINRNEKIWDPAFMAMVFRTKEGEISAPFKTKFGYHILKVLERNGDEAKVQHILLIPEATEGEIKESVTKLDSVRVQIVSGKTGFSEAALKYTEDESAKFNGPCFLARDGSTRVTIDQLDKDVVLMLDKLKPGEYSQPVTFTDDQGKKGVRIVYYKSRTEPHRLNIKDDYSRISSAALEEKKQQVLEQWLLDHLNTNYIMIDDEVKDCPQMKKWADAAARGF